MNKKYIAIGAATVIWMMLCTVANAQTYYVNSKSVGGDGSKNKPFSYIQQAADIVLPGDEVLIQPGIYYEQVDLKRSGTAEKPIVFRATEYGKNKVIITQADRNVREGKVQWKLEDKDLGIYSISHGQNVASLLYDDNWCFLSNNLEELKALKSTDYPIPQNSFCYDEKEKKLYVRLRQDEKYASSNPNKNVMCVGGPYYTSIELNKKPDEAFRWTGIGEKSYCFGILTEAPAYAVIYGLTFETPGFEGVYIRGSEVTVSNNWFKGCRGGVGGGARSMHDEFVSNNVTLEYNDWNLFPTFEDAVEIMQTYDKDDGLNLYFYWYMKSWRGGVFDYEAGGFFTRAGNNWTMRNNKLSSCLDAISYYHGLTYFIQLPGTNKNFSGKDFHYYENRFENCLDNGVETEDTSTNYNIHNNEFVNCFEPFSWQPLAKPYPTNIKLHHNVFCETEEYNKIRSERTYSLPSWLKIGSGAIDYSKPQYKDDFDASNGTVIKTRTAPDQGIMIYNNSVYTPNAYTMEMVGDSDNNLYLANNIVYAFAQPNPQKKRLFIRPGTFMRTGRGYIHEANMYIASNPEVELNYDDYSFNKGFGFKSMVEAGVKFDGTKFELLEHSPGRGAGVQVDTEKADTTDIGAISYGEKWHINYSPYPYGDVNCDKIIDLFDLQLIAKKNGISEKDETYDTRCDLNFDGIINNDDFKLWTVTQEGGMANE